MPELKDILNIVDSIHHLGGFDGSWVIEDYNNTKAALKQMRILFFVSVLITAGICFGILYLRFIVFGG